MDGTPIRSDDKPLHGRTKELESVEDVLDAVHARREGMLWLAGPAGIGKSRLLTAAEDRAIQQGFRVARVRTPGAAPGSASPPGDRADRCGREFIAPDEVLGWLENTAQPTVDDRDRCSTLVTVDDAQWADTTTVDALHSLPSRLAGRSIGWIMSGRNAPQEAGSDDLLGEWDALGAERVSVEALPDDVVDDVIGDVLGAPPDDDLRLMAELTAGNPQLLRALVDGLRDEGGLAVSGGQARLLCREVPARARAVMHYWVLELSALARHLLDVAAAAFDRPFSRDDLSDLLERPAEQLEPWLRELIEADLIVEIGDGHLVFRHELVRCWASGQVPADARCRLRDGSSRRQSRVGAGSSVRHSSGSLVGRDAIRTARQTREHVRRDRAWNRLTDSERTVATLVARGMTNREVAEQIFVSPHTVSFHLRKVYRKFGVGSRVELTRLLVEKERPMDRMPTLTLDPSIVSALVDLAEPAEPVLTLSEASPADARTAARVSAHVEGAPTRQGGPLAVAPTGVIGRPNFGWASLTAAELRVARLAATGLTNRVIADELELSPHTVESHLRHAFHKLDVRSRVELTRVVLAHGS